VLAQYSGSGRHFLGLPTDGCAVVVTARDLTTYEYSGALRQATDQWASIVTQHRRQHGVAIGGRALEGWLALPGNASQRRPARLFTWGLRASLGPIRS
jgi:hypothetical protein